MSSVNIVTTSTSFTKVKLLTASKKQAVNAQFQCHLNQMKPALQYTSEDEENNEIPSLQFIVMLYLRLKLC